VVVSGSRFLLSILIARALGLEDFGVYALLWTIVTFASAMQIPVTITPMMQLGPRVLGHRQEEFFATAMFTQLAYSVIAVPFVTFAAAVIVWGRPDALAIVLAINSYVLIFNQYEYFRRYLFTKGYRVVAFGIDAALYAILLAIILGFVWFGGINIAKYLFLSALPAFAFCLLTLRLYQFRATECSVHSAQGRRIWLLASPLIVSTIAGFISGHAFVYSSAFFLGTEEVGGIAAARNVMGPVIIFMMALENSITREAVILHRDRPVCFMAFVRQTQIKWALFFSAYAVVAVIFAEDLLSLSYGEDFRQFYVLVYWLGISSVPQVLSKIQAIKLRTVGNLSAIRDANISAMFIASIVAPVAIYLFGLNGAGFSIVIVSTSIMVIQFMKDRPSATGSRPSANI
jgi:O-antigen/teichoic acid export membrane protein